MRVCGLRFGAEQRNEGKEHVARKIIATSSVRTCSNDCCCGGGGGGEYAISNQIFPHEKAKSIKAEIQFNATYKYIWD